MTLSAEVEERLSALVAAIQGFEPILMCDPDSPSLDERRAAYDEALCQSPVPDHLTVRGMRLGCVGGEVVKPSRWDGDQTILLLHGGAYIAGSPRSHRGLAGQFAAHLNARVYVPDYRRAPEHPFPAPQEDCLSAYRGLLDSGQAPSTIAFVGDSAGGALVLSVMLMARDAGLPLPGCGVAISPWVNLQHSGASMISRAGRDRCASRAGCDLLAELFLAGASRTDPIASPLFADLSGLPPILIQVGENEVLLSDAHHLAQRLGESRVRVTLETWPGMFHAWHHFASVLPEAHEAVINAATFIEQSWMNSLEARARRPRLQLRIA